MKYISSLLWDDLTLQTAARRERTPIRKEKRPNKGAEKKGDGDAREGGMFVDGILIKGGNGKDILRAIRSHLPSLR